jgi:hypothetical protein
MAKQDGHWVTINGAHILIGGDAKGGVKENHAPSNVTGSHPEGKTIGGKGVWAVRGKEFKSENAAAMHNRRLTVNERRQAITGNVGANVRTMQDRISRAPSSRFSEGGRTGRFSTSRYNG